MYLSIKFLCLLCGHLLLMISYIQSRPTSEHALYVMCTIIIVFVCCIWRDDCAWYLGSLVSLEALCSSNRAGVKWTSLSSTYRGQIILDFSCTNSDVSVAKILAIIHLSNISSNNVQGDVILKDREDRCFHKNGGLPLLAHTRHRSMTHVISKDLHVGTTCTFTAHVLDRWEEPMDTVIAHCTIGGN